MQVAKETSDDENVIISVDNGDEYCVAEDGESQYEQNYEGLFFNANREVEDEEQSQQSLLSAASSSGDESDVSSLHDDDISDSNQKVTTSNNPPAAKPDPSTIPIKRSRSEKISGFARMTDHNIFDAIEYLSEESIGRAILKPVFAQKA